MFVNVNEKQCKIITNCGAWHIEDKHYKATIAEFRKPNVHKPQLNDEVERTIFSSASRLVPTLN
jgi:hypothetical protein